MLSNPYLPSNLLYASLLGIGGGILGGLGLLALPASVSRAQRYATLLAFCLAGLSGAAALLDKPRGLWAPGLAVAGTWLLGQVASWSWVNILASRVARGLRRPGVQLALLLAVSPVVVVCLLLPPPETDIAIHRSARALSGRQFAAAGPNKSLYARTDLDTPIVVLAMLPQDTADNLTYVQQQFVGELASNHLLICTGAADPGYNCHGWVFTAGCYWIDGEDVERILAQNGYHRVGTPRPGDLAIYRNGSEISHTAVVRMVDEEGLVLVESKWGQLGRYLHPADKLTFGHTLTYYRSTRQGHLLRGLERPGAPGTIAIAPAGPGV